MPYGLPHPEAREGEVWYCNVRMDEPGIRAQFSSFRRGETAYSYGGNPMPECWPVFVSESELETKDIDLLAIRRAMASECATVIEHRGVKLREARRHG